MALSPVASALSGDQLRILRETRQMVVAVIADYRQQLVYVGPSVGDAYTIAYRIVRDGELCLQAISDLLWDLWSMYVEIDTLSRRVIHRNGTTQ